MSESLLLPHEDIVVNSRKVASSKPGRELLPGITPAGMLT